MAAARASLSASPREVHGQRDLVLVQQRKVNLPHAGLQINDQGQPCSIGIHVSHLIH